MTGDTPLPDLSNFPGRLLADTLPSPPGNLLITGGAGAGKTNAAVQLVARWRAGARARGCADEMVVFVLDITGAYTGTEFLPPGRPSTRLSDFLDEAVTVRAVGETEGHTAADIVPGVGEWRGGVYVADISALRGGDGIVAAAGAILDAVRAGARDSGLDFTVIADDTRHMGGGAQLTLAEMLREGEGRHGAVVFSQIGREDIIPSLADHIDCALVMRQLRDEDESLLAKWPHLGPAGLRLSWLQRGAGYIVTTGGVLRPTKLDLNTNMIAA